MKKYFGVLISFIISYSGAFSQHKKAPVVENGIYSISWQTSNCKSFVYSLKSNNKSFHFYLPSFEVENKKEITVIKDFKLAKGFRLLKNGVLEYELNGSFVNRPSLFLKVTFQVAPDNPVLRFKYYLSSITPVQLTQNEGSDNIDYITISKKQNIIKEIRLSEFNERFHATHRSEYILDERYFNNAASFMGPLAVFEEDNTSFLLAYEHGSQYPDRFLEFKLQKNKTVSIASVKGNYLKNQLADGFTSVWFELAGKEGNEDGLAAAYRHFILKYITQNQESRKPYIFYNTWGRQERVHWAGQPYLASMNLDWTLNEIGRAHAMGIEVFVLDAGWFKKTGDWEVNKDFFSDELKQVKAKLDSYGMKLGLWFNPTGAALSSNMYKNNISNQMSFNGKYNEPHEIWETEKSVDMCLVSSYWEDFANKLISLTKQIGVSYFKWDAIGQYGCNDPNHYHGSNKNSAEERTQRYAFLQPEYMTKIIDKVCKEAPQSIFDFDITEDGRCVGLQFLSAGKYFIINNGPYYHNYDLAPMWKSVLPNNNANIFVEPGPARGWFVRSVLNYDKWIPSVVFLTHYQPDEPRNSQTINIASLILGQNGIWGEILKTSDSGVKLFDSILTKYKIVRDDITAAQLVKTGEPGGSPEVYEKIYPATGKGCVVIFANAKGSYSYITQSKTATKCWHNDDVEIKKDESGRSVITVHFSEPSAKILLFGTD